MTSVKNYVHPCDWSLRTVPMGDLNSRQKNSDYEPIVGALRHMENSAPSLKIFRTKFSTSALYNGRNKNRRQNPV